MTTTLVSAQTMTFIMNHGITYRRVNCYEVGDWYYEVFLTESLVGQVERLDTAINLLGERMTWRMRGPNYPHWVYGTSRKDAVRRWLRQ